ncbi:MAG: MiaB/RimO family radical SAM methylthiotransferase [Patescibacteria group bacterium]
MQPSPPQYYILTLGCQMNVSDSERMAAVLEDIGYTKSKTEQEANLIIVLACSVRQSAVNRIYGSIEKWNALKKKQPLVTVLSGCVLPPDRKKLANHFDIIIDSQQILDLPVKLAKLKNTKIRIANQGLPAKYADNYFAIKPKYTNNFQAYVPIMTGCNSFCTYCAVPYTRGRESSRTPQEILHEIALLLTGGFKEITLLGQIVNKYLVKVDDKFLNWLTKFQRQYKIPKLPELQADYFVNKKIFKFPQLLALAASLPGDYWLRYSSPHPKWFNNELIQTLIRYKKIPHHAHLPVQAGHDYILRKMLRPYSIMEYKKVITSLRKKIPDITITTDCIVGFPGETKKHFQASLALFKKIKFDMAYLAQFSSRTGTVAAKMPDDVNKKEKIRREKELNEVLKQTALDNNKKLLGTKQRVLVTNNKKVATSSYVLEGRTVGLKPIRFSAKQNLTGKFVYIKVTKVSPWHLAGKIIKKNCQTIFSAWQ